MGNNINAGGAPGQAALTHDGFGQGDPSIHNERVSYGDTSGKTSTISQIGGTMPLALLAGL